MNECIGRNKRRFYFYNKTVKMHEEVSSFFTRSIILVGNFIIGESFVAEFHVLEE